MLVVSRIARQRLLGKHTDERHFSRRRIHVAVLTQVAPIAHACQYDNALPKVPWHIAKLPNDRSTQETEDHVYESCEKQRS